MLKRKDIEYLKQVNGIRKKMGIALDSDEFNKHSFLSAIAEIKTGLSRKKAS